MSSFSQRAARVVASLCLVATGLHCGARSSLEAGRGVGSEGAGGDAGAPPATTGSGGEGGNAIEEPPCRLEVAGSAVEAIALANASASSPSVAAIESEGADPSGVAVQALTSLESHPVNQVARWRLAEDWPAGAVLEEPPSIFGIESHSWGATAPAPGGEGLAMLWYSDPGFVGRVAFRRLDFATWQGADSVDLSFEGGGPIALAAGAGVGAFGVGHAGLGYAAAWRQSDDTGMGFVAQPLIAILDETGQILLGPHALGPVMPSPGVSPSITWTGESYLLATSWGACDDPGCPGELTVHRFRPASGDAFDDSGIDEVWSEDVPDVAARPVLASHAGRTWMAYMVGPDEDGAPVTVLARELAPDGTRIGDALVVEEGTVPSGGLRMTAASFGLVLMWATDSGDPVLGPDDVGYTELQLRHLDYDGLEASPPMVFPATRYTGSAPSSLTAVERPRGVAFTWAGSADGPDVAYLGLLRCSENPR